MQIVHTAEEAHDSHTIGQLEQTFGHKWLVLDNPDETIPLMDFVRHKFGAKCWCNPVKIEGVLVHNSMDGREAYENGRKMS